MAGPEQQSNNSPEANEEARARAEAWGLDARAPGWEYLDFSDDKGEKPVVNSATGKERTFSEFDLYPRQEGQSSKEYGALLKKMHEKTAQYLEDEAKKEAEAKAIIGENGLRTENYEKSEFGQKELSAEASYDELEAKVNQAVAEGRITQENANKMLERKLEQSTKIIEGARQDYKDRQAVGTEEEQQRYEAFLQSHEEENQKNLEEREAVAKTEAEAEAKQAEEEKATVEMSEEEKQKQLEHDIAVVMNSFEHGHITEEDKDRMIKELTEKANGTWQPDTAEETAKEAVEEVDNRTLEEREQELQRDIAILKNSLEHGHITQEDYDNGVRELTKKAKLEDMEKLKLELEEKAKLELEEKAKLELEEKAKRELEEKAKLELGQKEDPEKPDEDKPLVAINADFSLDRKNLAQQAAETISNKDVSTGNYFKRLWKGTLFKKYFVKKYERELLEGTRTTVDGDTINELIEKRKAGAMERFELAVTEDMGYLHSEIGKKNKKGEYKDGERIEEADEKTQELVKETITEFVEMSKKYKNMNSDELKKQFIELFNRKQKEAKDNGEDIDTDVTNYGEVALQALELTMHGVAIENVMDGFKVYNAKANDEIRTEAHRDAIDKIVNAVESSKIGQVIPPEIIALSVGTAASLAQIGARHAASKVVPIVGGMLVSTAISGLRERNRITEDRAHMMRDIANGLEYQGAENPKNRRERYEARIGGTLYLTSKATDLVKGIEDALKTDGEGRSEAILSALAEARVRREYSDSEQKDLISYSSADDRGIERTELDKALIRAEKALSESDKEKYEEMKEYVRSKIIDGYETEDGEHIPGVTEQDKKFANRRALMATLKAGKTAAIGGLVFFASQAIQEVAAIIDPNKIGIFEKAGLIKTNNNIDANETMIAGLAGPSTYERIIGQDIKTVSGNDTQEMQRLSQEGYQGTMVNAPYTTTTQSFVEVDPASSNLATPSTIDMWYNNLSPDRPDLAELGIQFNNGIVDFRPPVDYAIGSNGDVIDLNQIAANGTLKGFLTLGKQRFEVVMDGFNSWGRNGELTLKAPDGSVGVVKAFDDSGKFLGKYFEVVKDAGVDANGIRHIMPISTASGPDSFDGTITQVVETTVEHPAVFEFTKTLTEDVTRGVVGNAGIAFAPDTARQGLGVATAAGAAQEAPVEPTDTPTEPVETPAEPEETPEPAQELSPQQAREIEAQQNLEEQTELSSMINGLANTLGGSDAIANIMMQLEPTEQDFGPDGNYSKWWNSLTPEAQMNALEVFEAVKRVDENRARRGVGPISWGAGIRKWVLDELYSQSFCDIMVIL